MPIFAAKGVILNSVNSVVSRPNVTKIVCNVQKFIQFNLLKSELRYCNPFRNGTATKEMVREKRHIFDFNCLPRQRPFRNLKNLNDVN